ncbi:MAG: hypothetical protein RG740_07650, partial [Acholeplasmataceae bacterium]|nr:hypothetical protein [Acholeplasmataceae bacterium]
MKKLFFVVLLLLFSMGLASCGNSDEILTEITDLKDGIEALEESLGVDIDELRSLIAELRASVDQANDAIDELSGDLDDTNDAISQINTDLAALEVEIQALVADLLEANGKINDADLAIAQLTELVTMYIEFEAFDVEALATPLDSYFVELPNESERGASYD